MAPIAAMNLSFDSVPVRSMFSPCIYHSCAMYELSRTCVAQRQPTSSARTHVTILGNPASIARVLDSMPYNQNTIEYQPFVNAMDRQQLNNPFFVSKTIKIYISPDFHEILGSCTLSDTTFLRVLDKYITLNLWTFSNVKERE